MTPTTLSRTPLRLVLRIDAVVSGLNGAAYLLLADPLSGLLGLPVWALRAAGVFLLVFAAAVWSIGERPAPASVRTVLTGNLLWTAASIVAVALDLGTPTTVGATWLVLQAVAVAAFALLQAGGLRRS